MSETANNKAYLGDGVYAEFDGAGVVLTTQDGVSIQNTIFLEPEVFENLTKYGEALWKQ